MATGTRNKPQTDANGNGENATAEGTAAAPKVKKEKIFASASNYTELRKREIKLNQKFERAAKQVKNLGVSEDTQAKIIELLKAEHKTKAEAVFAGQGSTESFV